MTLESGMYEASQNKRVTVWRKPDADGDGDEVWRDKTGPNGQQMGRERVTDNQGRPVRHYSPPEGFKNFPSFDHTDNYIRVKENGQPFRTPDGETVGIKPGSVLVEHGDGRVELIEDEYEAYLFEQRHQRKGEVSETPSDRVAADQDDSQEKAARVAELRRQLAELDADATPDETVRDSQ